VLGDEQLRGPYLALGGGGSGLHLPDPLLGEGDLTVESVEFGPGEFAAPHLDDRRQGVEQCRGGGRRRAGVLMSPGERAQRCQVGNLLAGRDDTGVRR